MEKRTGTFSKIYIQIVFAVRYRRALLDTSWENKLYKYITGIVQNKSQLLVAINGHKDHIHILIAIKPACNLSDLVREIKKASSEFVNSSGFVNHKFSWQEGYGAFSYSRWDVNMIVNYINNQKEHHRVRSFREEYLELLDQFGIEYKPEFLFEWIADESTAA